MKANNIYSVLGTEPFIHKNIVKALPSQRRPVPTTGLRLSWGGEAFILHFRHAHIVRIRPAFFSFTWVFSPSSSICRPVYTQCFSMGPGDNDEDSPPRGMPLFVHVNEGRLETFFWLVYHHSGDTSLLWYVQWICTLVIILTMFDEYVRCWPH